MKFLEVQAENFGSYKKLQFSFENLGLCLLTGQTGAGKSTLQDLIPWAMFGITAKNGSVDEVRTWESTQPTKVYLSLLLGDNTKISISRIRGKPNENDLYWFESMQSEPQRGKDLNDTQKLLNHRLGITSDTYLTAVYFNEFSPTSTFFLDKKSVRRELFENLVDLSFPIFLHERTSNEKKSSNTKEKDVSSRLSAEIGKASILRDTIADLRRRNSSYQAEKGRRIELLNEQLHSRIKEKKIKSEIISQKREKYILDLEDKRNKFTAILNNSKDRCGECGQPNQEYRHAEMGLKDSLTRIELFNSKDPFEQEYRLLDINISQLYDKIELIKIESNPYSNQLEAAESRLLSSEEHIKNLQNILTDIEDRIIILSQLNKLSSDLRGVLLSRTVQEIQNKTNYYLSKYFDSEIQTFFTLTGETLDIELHKNSHVCSYTQLSRGQRSMLRLCFAVAVMKASANKAGIHFSALFFDEVLDGLSSDLKIKALGVFQELELEHNSILVIDHAIEIQSHFDRRFNVTLQSDESIIEEV